MATKERWLWDRMLNGASSLVRRLVGRRHAGILVYHAITPELFEAHVGRLVRLYNIIPLDQLVRTMECHDWTGMPPRSLVITFDDGLSDFAKLEHVIRRFRLPITQFLVSGGVGTNRHNWCSEVQARHHTALKRMPNQARLEWLKAEVGFDPEREYPEPEMLSREQVRHLSRIGVQFGAHTVTHPELPMCDDETTWREILQSKAQLERSFHFKVEHFAYPSGSFTNRDVGFARKAGFRSARGMRRGWNGIRTDPYRLRDLGPGDGLSPCQIGRLELLSIARRFAKLLERIRS